MTLSPSRRIRADQDAIRLGLREACEAVFRLRATHPWPPVLDVPPHWAEPFARLAAELDLTVDDIDDGVARVRAFVDHIVAG